jgi:dTMP kinase
MKQILTKIEFEGTDGAGKTTALKYFIEQARQRGLNVKETREVGNPNVPACVKMREFVLDPNSNLCGEAMELIFSAMRYENDRWYRNLASESEAGTLVVSDRGWFSHLAYTDHNVSPEFTQKLYQGLLAQSTLLPDVVIYFKVDTETALKRRVKRGEGMDVIEMKGVEFQEKVRESFLKHINLYNHMIRVYEVDANQDIDGVRTQIDAILNRLVPQAA